MDCLMIVLALVVVALIGAGILALYLGWAPFER